MKKIKWGCIQPLTGGMYIGTENAIGCKADWVLSYPGLSDIKLNQDGTIREAGNEYNLLMWCKKRNEIPAYQLFNRKPFDDVDVDNVEIIDDSVWTTEKVDTKDTDIVVSVPVCSGLSQATIAKDDTKDARNNNMIFNAEYTLKKINPKVYIFENAPTLFTHAGDYVKGIINGLAKKYGYSVIYYKTNTKFHDNCQNRPRTFVFMIKNINGKVGCPSVLSEHISPTIPEYFDRIPKNATQQEVIEMSEDNSIIMDFIKYKYGNDYRNSDYTWSMYAVIDSGDEFYEWLKNANGDKDVINKLKAHVDHIHYKIGMNKNFYSLAPGWMNAKSETAPVCMFKNILTTIHYKEDRLLTPREWLHLMGHPVDFEFYGDYKLNCNKIGQNVPARTAQFIVSEAVRMVNNWETILRNNPEVYMYDNTKMPVKMKTKQIF